MFFLYIDKTSVDTILRFGYSKLALHTTRGMA